MPCYAMLCYAILCCAVLCYAMLCCVVLLYLCMLCLLRYATLYFLEEMLCYAVCEMLLYYSTLLMRRCYAYATLPCAALRCAMLCYAMLCYAMLCYADVMPVLFMLCGRYAVLRYACDAMCAMNECCVVCLYTVEAGRGARGWRKRRRSGEGREKTRTPLKMWGKIDKCCSRTTKQQEELFIQHEQQEQQ